MRLRKEHALAALLVGSLLGIVIGSIWVFSSQRASKAVRYYRLHGGAAVSAVAFSPNGRHAASGSQDKVIRLWEVHTGREIGRFAGHNGGILTLAFSPDGRQLVSGGSDGRMFLWDVQTGRRVREVPGRTQRVTSAVFSPDGRTILSADATSSLLAHDPETGRKLYSLPGHQAGIWCVGFSGDGRLAISCGDDGTTRIWDVAGRRQLHCFQSGGGNLWCAALGPRGRLAASGGERGWTAFGRPAVHVWDAQGGQEIHAFELPVAARAVKFSPDGKYLLAGGGNGSSAGGTFEHSLRLWDLRTGKPKRTFVGHTRRVNCIAISADGRYALSASADGTVRLWQLPR